MKAVNSLGGGPWGRRLAMAAGLALLVIMFSFALLSSGCGSDDNQGTSTSQLDDTAGGSGTSSLDDVASAGGAEDENGTTTGDSQEDVMVDYTWDECVADMTFRYADEDAANRVCNSIREDYSDSSQEDLATVLPTVEAKENVSAQQGSSSGGGTSGGTSGGNSGGTSGGSSGGGTNGSDDTGGGNSGGSSGGWGEIEIQVPDQGPTQ